MRVLVFGGTRFLGRHLAEACLARGHAVTLFHRGLSDPSAVPSAEHVIGDRDRDLAPLRGRTWDAVFDTSGYEVRPVREAARAIGGAHYVFVSSISVYRDFSRTDEEAPLCTLAAADDASLTLERYGALKAACERALDAELPRRVQHVRAGLILGPHDYDERFRYWLTRIARGGEVLAPGDPDARVQFIDVRDLAAWMLRSAEARVTGTFNATGPGEMVTMRSLLETIRGVTGGDARFTWVKDDVLAKHEVGAYSEMPFWLPASLGARPIEVSRARSAGLTYRPYAETVRDTWAWMQSGWDEATTARENRRLRVRGGMTEERELAILADARASASARVD